MSKGVSAVKNKDMSFIKYWRFLAKTKIITFLHTEKKCITKKKTKLSRLNRIKAQKIIVHYQKIYNCHCAIKNVFNL